MYSIIRKALFQMDPERAHHLTLSTLSLFPSMASLLTSKPHPSQRLKQTLWSSTFPHPVGLAAGLDKNGVAINALLECGFSFVEVGTVTPRPQPGNEKPRLFRLVEDGALINRMGFNNLGVHALRKNVLKKRRPGIVGINLGKNKDTPNEDAAEDYLKSLDVVYNVADYIVVNVSSPNTPGLRDLQAESALVPLVERVVRARDAKSQETAGRIRPYHVPVLVKLAPDLSDDSIRGVTRALLDIPVDGFIATNTTIARNGLSSPHQGQTGGLSGKPLRDRSTEVIRLMFSVTKGTVPIIGSGGIFNASDAYEKIRAGANLVQIYTGFIFKGPGVVREIVDDLDKQLQRDGFASITEAVGIDAPLT